MHQATTALRALAGAGLVGALALTGATTSAPAADATTVATSADADPGSPLAGTPVTGVDVGGNDQVSDEAPQLEPGAYTDELTVSEDTWRAYRVSRTAPESTLHVSLTTKPSSYADSSDEYTSEDLRIRILASDGTECRSESVNLTDRHGTRPFVTVAATVVGKYPDEDEGEASCRATGTFTVLVGREGAEETTPTELLVLEEPPVTNLTELPEAEEDYPDEVDLGKEEATPVTGGTGFSDAPEVTSGTWSDTLTPGETRVYRVWVDYGQTVRFTANGPTGGFRFPAEHENDRLWVDGRAYAPDRRLVGSNYSSPGDFSASYGSSPKSVTSAPVLFRNRFANGDVTASSMGGWYYYAVSIGDSDVGEVLADESIATAFTVEIEGESTDAVTYDHDAGDWSSPSDEAGSTQDGLPTWLPWLAGGLLGAVLLGTGAWLGVRRLLAGSAAQESVDSQL